MKERVKGFPRSLKSFKDGSTAVMKNAGGQKNREVFDKFIDERYSNYRKPENTLRSYLDLLNQVVLRIKKPFSEITYEDLIPSL